MYIPFNKAPIVDTTISYISKALGDRQAGDGIFTAQCSSWMESRFDVSGVLLTTSGSHALDMSAYLCEIQPGDEVIMASYTFSSTANAFAGRGAKIVFVDIRPDTMNIDESLIEEAVTDRTKVIVPMHYAGVSCEMDMITDIAQRHELIVVEDAAQGVMSTYKGRSLGTIGDFGCYSFHETKNYSMGEGGALLIRDPSVIQKAEIIREKGTNRSRFFRGEIDKYSWVDWGSSYLPSEMNAAYLWSQLEVADEINLIRLARWQQYYEALKPLEYNGLIELPHIPEDCVHNAHMFYIKVVNESVQSGLITHLKQMGIAAVFHYVPLHSSEAGRRLGRFHGEDRFTTIESSRLIRLPMFYSLTSQNVQEIVASIYGYFQN
ncbi:dTDP-4-amino-4,6-dideoxygalactose transaminase [Paenibacillus sacheonensis]|uniref:dTDP-4-amino-4,6-dideoxygalactose transaminase n=1 Tax=Paenibacillus sacheonensis TaxID=742054 RepID=A0A7X5C594_9BACL|nr:dTDP-4-amino-4,6-dideoxygalactose transaminase [Paenibacillus sacheonensis]MBM7566461.1 dTDP-4-amino-4,6-dideoxygalactose transaminase [Paenibacillus sacheonensis]NBC73144.1 dTDP-4-amino-4,6-dideoxygalactose transaminase [Paenibacillus sacheonensis]